MYNQPTSPWDGIQPPGVQPRRYGILTVSGEASIAKLLMLPNDNALALDEGDSLLYYIRTDSAGEKSVARFRLTPEPSPQERASNQLSDQLQQILAQMQNMTERMTRMEEKVNAKSNYADDDGRGRKRRPERTDADGEDGA